jgi:hypothetical protein
MPGLSLSVGGVSLELRAAESVLAASRERWAPFVGSGARPIVLTIRASQPFDGAYERELPVRVVPAGPRALSFTAEDGCGGRVDLDGASGELWGARGVAAVDALLRAALSLALPASGALLVHAALVPRGEEALVFAGASGAGKSTACALLGGVCDEMTVLRPSADTVQALATPWWRGRAFSAPRSTLYCLGRAGREHARVTALSGASAVRALMPNVARFTVLPAIEREIFSLSAAICAAAPVFDARCPEGAAFSPFVSELARAEAA